MKSTLITKLLACSVLRCFSFIQFANNKTRSRKPRQSIQSSPISWTYNEYMYLLNQILLVFYLIASTTVPPLISNQLTFARKSAFFFLRRIIRTLTEVKTFPPKCTRAPVIILPTNEHATTIKKKVETWKPVPKLRSVLVTVITLQNGKNNFLPEENFVTFLKSFSSAASISAIISFSNSNN